MGGYMSEREPTGDLIYLDYAATAGRRPAAVGEAVVKALEQVSANPGRSGHALSIAAARIVEETRSLLAEFIGAPDPAGILFTKNATEAINLVLNGLLKEDDLVMVSSWEHNAVMRPMRWLEEDRGVRMEFIPPGTGSPVDLEWLAERLGTDDVRMVVLMTASNVTGEIMPVADVGGLCSATGTFLMVDAAQGAGMLPIDVVEDSIDALCLTGHKGLLGPPGTGAAWLRDPAGTLPLIRGGTGSRSREEHQPEFAPDRFEAGTLNVPGIAGLRAGLEFINERGRKEILERTRNLTAMLLDMLGTIEGMTFFGPPEPERHPGIVSFTLEGFSTSDMAHRLEEFGILTRPGLHCAPRAHYTLGTMSEGTVRLSFSHMTGDNEIERGAEAVRMIADNRS